VSIVFAHTEDPGMNDANRTDGLLTPEYRLAPFRTVSQMRGDNESWRVLAPTETAH
jgi:hypothetical protein